MNVYRFRFVARCPVDGEMICYRAEIRAPHTIRVEQIMEALPNETLHETLANDLFAKFGGDQRIVAVHSGVEIETLRP